MRDTLFLAVWTFLAGAGIPLIGLLNSGVARALGNPISATAVMFAVAFVGAGGIALPLYGLPSLAGLGAAPIGSYGAGLLIGFYAISATIIIPRFGAGNFVTVILLAQLVTAALIDQFGLFGTAQRPLDLLKLGGLALVLGGIIVLQLAGRRAVAG
jgi:bacterial/archaeal transporter family-2 protein